MQYVISDIHGHYDMFMKMLEKIKFSSNDHLYILGDVIDRGPNPIKTLQWVFKQKNVELLLGNHEIMLLMALNKNDIAFQCWMQNGGEITLDQFNKLRQDLKDDIVKNLIESKYLIELDKYILVHAGINPNNTIDKQDKDDLIWIREDFINSPTKLNKKVVFGHTPTQYIDYSNWGKIWHDQQYKDKIGIDCGVYSKKGNLGCLCLDNLDEFYIEK